MLQVLKRFEEESAENEETFELDEDEDGLSQRLANLDIGKSLLLIPDF